MNEASGLARAPLSMGKPEAVLMLARQAGISGVDPYAHDVGAAIARLPVLGNGHLAMRASAEIPGLSTRVVFPALHRPVAPPRFLNGRHACFPEHSGTEISPQFSVLTVPGGHVAQISRAPVVLTGDGTVAIQDYSSRYAGLAHSFDFDMRLLLADARIVAGAAVVLCDDIHPINYSHWILDELPRLALLGERRDVTVVTSDEDRAFKRESLRLCGFPDSRVVYLGDFQAVRADHLLVPSDIADMPHPAHKAAPWVMDFLRAQVGFAALAGTTSGAMPTKLYVSRNDTTGRRVLNEDALMDLLGPAGYECVTLSGRSLAEQVGLFARATHVVAPHGAGLTNFAFAPRGSRLLEIFPRTYGTPAYYVLAAGQGNPYASYIAQDIEPGDRDQTDNIRIDVADFSRLCGALI